MGIQRETPPANQRGVGGYGGFGAGPQLLTLPIGDTLGRKIEIPRMGLDEFCTEYKLGNDIFRILDEAELEVRGLIGVDDLGKKEIGLKVGQVAEVKWALKALLLKCSTIEEVLIPRGHYRRDRGDGGFGEKLGGAGGVGEASTINMNLKDLFRFRHIGSGVGGIGGANFFLGGVGGAGGADGLPFGNNSAYGKNPNGEEGSSSPYAENDGGISGGKGGHGGRGHLLGGKGGVGGAPIIPLEAIGALQWIQGGRGGDGGAAVEVGGSGGRGKAPKFPKPLAVIDQATRLQVQAKNMKLKDGEKVNEKLLEFKFDIGEILLNRLHDHGFQTVGGLFEINDIDLDVAPFKRANKHTLEYALGEFLKERDLSLWHSLGVLDPSLVPPVPSNFKLRSAGVYAPRMPCTTKTQIQSNILYVAENITAASIMLEDDPDDSDLMGLDEEEAEFFSDDISDVLEL
ncbi:hypothetical protein B0H19DRAFT_1070266 [Mycena capillaripes]|nr:hypothetical protein B0H19DRAFT_1070266 [Mycena capillaripes]